MRITIGINNSAIINAELLKSRDKVFVILYKGKEWKMGGIQQKRFMFIECGLIHGYMAGAMEQRKQVDLGILRQARIFTFYVRSPPMPFSP